MRSLVIALAAATWLGAPAPALAAFPGANGRLVFAEGDGQGPWGLTTKAQPLRALFTANADGSDRRRITDGTTLDGDPMWSPDGRRILYTSVRYQPPRGDTERSVRIIDAAGRSLARIDCMCFTPAWSADGRRIVVEQRFLIDKPPYGVMQHDIVVMGTDGTRRRRLTNDVAVDRYPVWSPRGDLIAFQRERRERIDIYVIRPDGSGLRRLTRGGGFHPTWSPDGRLIAYSTRVGRTVQIVARPARGGTAVRLTTDSTTGNDTPVWSPDGTLISYLGTKDFAVRPYVQRVAVRRGDCLRFRRAAPRLRTGFENAVGPDWRPRPSAAHRRLRFCSSGS